MHTQYTSEPPLLRKGVEPPFLAADSEGDVLIVVNRFREVMNAVKATAKLPTPP